jgi:hypothetical protein
MSRSFEELAGLDQDVIVQKSHIVHSTLDDVINKRFSKFNPVKAKGIAHTLEKDFNIDMSSWLKEYNDFRNHKEDSIATIDKAAFEAIEDSKIPMKKVLKSILIVAITIVAGYVVITNNPLNTLGTEQNMSDTQYKAELNKTEEANATNAALAVPDENGTLPSVLMPQGADSNATKTEQNSTQKAPEANKAILPTVQPSTKAPTVAPVNANGKLLLESTKKLWYKVINLDNNKTEEAIIEPGRLEIDGTKNKILIIGHQQVKISMGQSIIEPKAGAKIRYLVKDNKLTPISEDEVFKLQGKPTPTSKPQLDNN